MADTAQEAAVKVALLEQRLDTANIVFGRLENAIEKIGNVSMDIKQMLAVHEERIDSINAKITINEKKTIMTNENVASDIKELRERIVTVNTELTELFHTSETHIIENQNDLEAKIIAGQNELKQYFIENNEKLEKRVKFLENWRYVLVGMFLVLGALFGFIAQNSISINAIP